MEPLEAQLAALSILLHLSSQDSVQLVAESRLPSMMQDRICGLSQVTDMLVGFFLVAVMSK